MKLLIKTILIIIGTLSLVLGIIGIVLPLIPTTPFLLLAATCFVRSSSRLYNWLITNKWFGGYIINFREGKGIPLKAKVIGVTMLWTSIIYSAFFIVPLVIVRILMLLVACYFTWYILSQKTLGN
ncbi:YbaN family protein [Halobacillus shinanisalinarum]|uniref:YbaN family protein n=1 Tax=Halobacillus shinanisalinarum TaxID=2932258 RepID=A0ABY4H576_9BACI|nr:YbaN family protein [Halobacillus shinanisalinarum]UOQ95461.1 YbaN family protein [Halobacillus shinanisalinarum]